MKLLRLAALVGLLSVLAAAVAAKDDIVVALQSEPPHLDPTGAAAGAIDQVLYANVFEGLTRFGPDGSIRPGLAESWTVSEDGRVYVFQLRKGVTFHDGTKMDAKDVKFTLDRARDETSQNAHKDLYQRIKEVEVLSPLQVRITLEAPDGALPIKLAWGDVVIVGPESIGDIRQKPVGTGPFRFKEWIHGEEILLERNPYYWGEAAKLQQVTFRFIDGPIEAYSAMMSGDVDAFPDFPNLQILTRFEADPRFQVLVGTGEGETILAINNGVFPFEDIRVRRAISHAIDRHAVIEVANFGLGTPIGTHFAPHNPAYVDLTENSAYNPALAIALLAEAGFEDGFSTSLKLPPPSYARRGGQVIADQLRAVGIEVEIINLSWPEWKKEVYLGKDFDLTLVSHLEVADIGIYGSKEIYFQYEGEAFRELLQKLRETQDPEERVKWLGEAQTLIAKDYVNAYLFQQANVTVADARLRGLWQNAPVQATDLTGVYWAD